MEAAEPQITLRDIPVGGRLLVRSSIDWRVAVVSRTMDDQVTISISSPKGRNYRIRRAADTEIGMDGRIPFLVADFAEAWRDNFTRYDSRW